MQNTSDLVNLIDRASSLPQAEVHKQFHKLSAAFEHEVKNAGARGGSSAARGVSELSEAMDWFYAKTYPLWCFDSKCALCDLDEWRK